MIDGSDICLNDIKADEEYMDYLLKTDLSERIAFEVICNHFEEFKLNITPKELLHWYAKVGMPFIYPIKYYSTDPLLLFGSTQLPIAYGVYLQISSVSHSCVPNTAFVTNGIFEIFLNLFIFDIK